MASSASGAPAQSAPQSTPSRLSSENAPRSTSPLEMATLTPSPEKPLTTDTTAITPETALQPQSIPESTPDDDRLAKDTQEVQVSPVSPPSPKPAPPITLNRNESEAIGPSTDTPAAKPDNANGPVCVITLLLTTGARHPYKIDEKYLKKRNVQVEANDPYNISVYTLKELIWRDWREEWEARPTSPSSIRLIHFGRMLDDKVPLKDCRFQTEAPNVVHMTVKPQEVVDEEDGKTGKIGNRRDGEDEVHAGCRCVIL